MITIEKSINKQWNAFFANSTLDNGINTSIVVEFKTKRKQLLINCKSTSHYYEQNRRIMIPIEKKHSKAFELLSLPMALTT